MVVPSWSPGNTNGPQAAGPAHRAPWDQMKCSNQGCPRAEVLGHRVPDSTFFRQLDNQGCLKALGAFPVYL